MKSLRTTLILGVLIFTIQSIAQSGQPKLVIDIQGKKVNITTEEAAGEKDIVYAPGDTIEYTIYAKNSGDGLMKNPVVVDPIPEGTEYIIDSAKGENSRIIFSVNNGMQYSVWPVLVSAKSESGAPVQREANREEVTHIKWILKDEIPAGEQKILSFQVLVK